MNCFWLVVWKTGTRLLDGKWSYATRFDDGERAREAAERGGGILLEIPLDMGASHAAPSADPPAPR